MTPARHPKGAQLGANWYPIVQPIQNASFIYLSSTPSQIVGETALKIGAFAYLSTGWDYGRGGPIPQHIRDRALEWNRFFQSIGLLETNAFPGADCEISVTAGYGDHYFEVIAEPDGSTSLAYDFKDKQDFYYPNVSSYEAQRRILEVLGRSWATSFGYFIQTNTTRGATNGVAVPSAIRPQTIVSQSSTSTASSNPVGHHAPIYANTTSGTLASLGSPRYFGDFLPVYFPRVAA